MASVPLRAAYSFSIEAVCMPNGQLVCALHTVADKTQPLLAYDLASKGKSHLASWQVYPLSFW